MGDIKVWLMVGLAGVALVQAPVAAAVAVAELLRAIAAAPSPIRAALGRAAAVGGAAWRAKPRHRPAPHLNVPRRLPRKGGNEP